MYCLATGLLTKVWNCQAYFFYRLISYTDTIRIFESESTTLCAIFSDREHSPLAKLYGRLSLVSLVSFFDLPCRFHPLILSSF